MDDGKFLQQYARKGCAGLATLNHLLCCVPTRRCGSVGAEMQALCIRAHGHFTEHVDEPIGQLWRASPANAGDGQGMLAGPEIKKGGFHSRRFCL
jgi:hypothetical protein